MDIRTTHRTNLDMSYRYKMKRYIFILILIASTCNAVDEDKIKKEVLAELNLKAVPTETDISDYLILVDKLVSEKYPKSALEDLKKKFNSKYPIIKIGDNVDLQLNNVKIEGQLKSVSKQTIIIEDNSYSLNLFSKDVQLRIDKKKRYDYYKKYLNTLYYKRVNTFKESLLHSPKNPRNATDTHRALLTSKLKMAHQREFKDLYNSFLNADEIPSKRNSAQLTNDYYTNHFRYLKSECPQDVKDYIDNFDDDIKKIDSNQQLQGWVLAREKLRSWCKKTKYKPLPQTGASRSRSGYVRSIQAGSEDAKRRSIEVRAQLAHLNNHMEHYMLDDYETKYIKEKNSGDWIYLFEITTLTLKSGGSNIAGEAYAYVTMTPMERQLKFQEINIKYLKTK
ncbi:hypothetical protein PQO03_18625 [Lentisphaera profundi]|uniref:Uncharacterized protein n=1 Tax=Lentisphaera profundi TaxID=1658616 RepID=A0ABY7W0N8_9BACT|nr:hypothetical protein [Lentisphaera profundi]WDE97843.1 hypothetical protein PQO03_18625 [Lentisphaera profundi]